MSVITPMTESDVPFAVSLTDQEGWGHTAADFSRLMRLEPEGCFLARENDQPVGMITSTRHGDYAFLGDLIVRPGDRGHGIGAALMTHAVAYLQSHGVRTIELDGVFAAVSLYRRLGFRDKYLSLRFRRERSFVEAKTVPRGSCTIDELIAYDRARTGLDRGQVLTQFMHEFSDHLFVDRTRDIEGYAFLRAAADGLLNIGPLVADRADTAASLLSAIIAACGGHNLGIGIPEINRAGVALLRRHGFLYRPPSLRMSMGERQGYESSTYAICSPEKG
jgi:ribosomal protein S18 acetylase RimI-like enzyme